MLSPATKTARHVHQDSDEADAKQRRVLHHGGGGRGHAPGSLTLERTSSSLAPLLTATTRHRSPAILARVLAAVASRVGARRGTSVKVPSAAAWGGHAVLKRPIVPAFPPLGNLVTKRGHTVTTRYRSGQYPPGSPECKDTAPDAASPRHRTGPGQTLAPPRAGATTTPDRRPGDRRAGPHPGARGRLSRPLDARPGRGPGDQPDRAVPALPRQAVVTGGDRGLRPCRGRDVTHRCRRRAGTRSARAAVRVVACGPVGPSPSARDPHLAGGRHAKHRANGGGRAGGPARLGDRRRRPGRRL